MDKYVYANIERFRLFKNHQGDVIMWWCFIKKFLFQVKTETKKWENS